MKDKKDTWTRKEVAEITGIPDRRILFYTEQPGLLLGMKTDTGRGTAREYSIGSIFYLLIIKELSSLGLSLAKIKSIIWRIRAEKLLESWRDGEFAGKTIVMVIVPNDDNTNSALSASMHTLSSGDADFNLVADRPSQIIINLNKVFEKAKL